ncbi:hypothetical protein Enr13x_52140 [Stieleria neptunia]|uniref:Uncharacterized protein n=1 Tax=Stieleria neptunia TaxID=2527979 RepID=A0A518HWV1_9BACT|nr:hypothetical protein [Stieleria neptunia]QDV45338.1 hypothetical protein Enr13x_52140 [Stieleria neptunia]
MLILRLMGTFLAVGLAFVVPASAQDPAVPGQETTGRSKRLFDRFDQTAKDLEIQSQDGQVYQWQRTPLFRFSSEGNVFGSVFVWQTPSKRLALIGTIGSIPINRQDYEFVELHLLRPTPIVPMTVGKAPRKRWMPAVDELELKTVPSAPAVSTDSGRRLVQMRGMARQFKAEMIHKGQTNHLRLLPQPLFRYQDSTAEFDGALFAFVWDNGTDPELLLRIEVQRENDQSVWKYQAVRFTWRQLRLHHQGKPVWEAEEFLERDGVEQRTPYLTGLTDVIPE